MAAVNCLVPGLLCELSDALCSSPVAPAGAFRMQFWHGAPKLSSRLEVCFPEEGTVFNPGAITFLPSRKKAFD